MLDNLVEAECGVYIDAKGNQWVVYPDFAFRVADCGVSLWRVRTFHGEAHAESGPFRYAEDQESWGWSTFGNEVNYPAVCVKYRTTFDSSSIPLYYIPLRGAHVMVRHRETGLAVGWLDYSDIKIPYEEWMWKVLGHQVLVWDAPTNRNIYRPQLIVVQNWDQVLISMCDGTVKAFKLVSSAKLTRDQLPNLDDWLRNEKPPADCHIFASTEPVVAQEKTWRRAF